LHERPNNEAILPSREKNVTGFCNTAWIVRQKTLDVLPVALTFLGIIERTKKDDAIWERSKELMRNAVRTIMAEFAVDLDTALDWVNSASGMTALAMDDEPRR
jgi:hypothetical protein